MSLALIEIIVKCTIDYISRDYIVFSIITVGRKEYFALIVRIEVII